MIMNKPILQPTGEYNYIQHDQHLQIFHSKIFKSIYSWSTDPNNYQNPTCNKWNNAIQEGMKEQTSWEEIKVLLGISSYKEYYNMIAHCNTIRQQYYMFLVDNTYISYCTYQPKIDVPKPIPVTPVKNNLSTSNSYDLQINDEELLQLPILNHDDTTITMIHDDDMTNNWIVLKSIDHLHMIMTNIITSWIHDHSNRSHPFTVEWIKATYFGLMQHSTWDTICSKLSISTIDEYITYIEQCPIITKEYQIDYNPTTDTLRYRHLRTEPTEQMHQEFKNITDLHQRISEMSHSFNKTLHQLNEGMKHTILRTEECAEKINTQVERGNDRISTYCAHQMNLITAFISQQKDAAKSHIQHFIDTSTTDFQSNITKFLDEHMTATVDHYNDIKTTLSSYMHEATTLPDISKQQKRSKLFPDANPTYYEPAQRSRNPFDTVTETSNQNIKTNACENIYINKQNKNKNEIVYKEENNNNGMDPWGKYGPIMKNEQIGIKELPPVLTMKMTTNVKIQYTTAEESYHWYYRLKWAIHPYGVLLIPVEEFEPEKSLCPRTYYGKQIDPAHYTLMSQALYQLLDSEDTISRDNTEIVNKVTKYASNTNGYATLYDIMAQIHPLLNPDAPFPPPMTKNCTDIHEYYNQVEAYFLHNKLEQNYLTPRKKVQIFLNGMDETYAPAIRILTQKLKEWPQDQHEPPRYLVLDSLPKKIEDIMKEDAYLSRPIVRITRHRPTQPNRRMQTLNSDHQLKTRPMVDSTCRLCQGYGHKRIDCDKMAQYLILQEQSQHLDEKMKNKILDIFSKTLEKRKQQRMQRIKGIVRQLYTDGQYEEADKYIDTIPTFMTNGFSDDDQTQESNDS